MTDWLSHRVRATPSTTAVIDTATETHRSYADLDASVDDLAGRLAALGFGSGDHLGTVLETRLASIRLVHAAARLGCVLVPLSARLTPGELGSRIEHADITGVICGADTEAATLEAAGDLPVASVDPSEATDPKTTVVALDGIDPIEFEPSRSSLDAPQVMLFTSGTTGDPKLVVLTVQNLLASAVASAFRLGVTPDDRWLDVLSIYHMGGLAPVIRTAIYGTTLVVGDTRESFDPAATRRALEDYGCTGVSLVPTMLRRMLDTDADAKTKRRDGEPGGLSEALRFALLGGAPASEELIERCADRTVPVCPSYGMTETASQAATARPEEAISHPGTVGRPLVTTEFAILDGNGTPVESGETGEIVVSGPSVTPGYYDDSDATTAAFSKDGFHTGDLGLRDASGRLWVTGRRDDRILTGGEIVDPEEVRGALCDHPEVRDAAVVGLSDPEYGERVGALVVADGTVGTDALKSQCRERLAGFKLPRTIRFVEELPRTASGTIERAAVRKRLRES